MARPMPWLAAFLISGILFARFVGVQAHFFAFFAFGLAACLIAIIYFFTYKRKISLIFPIMAAIGTIFYFNAISPRDMVLEEVSLRNGFVRFEGVVTDASVTRTGRQRAAVNTSFFRIGPSPGVHYSQVGVMVYLPEGMQAALGQRIFASGYLLPLDGPRNPGGFDEFQFFRARGVDYILFAEGFRGYEISPTIPMHIRNFGISLAAVFDQTLPEDFAGIMTAMIVGDRSGLEGEVRDAYRAVGMFHILVVSGLHVAVLTVFVEHSLKLLGMGLKNRSLLTILFIVIFTALTGAGIATVRAAIMGIMFMAAGLFGYENDTPTTMSLAAVVLLLHQPLFLFDAGFIYSFSVVAALIFATNPCQKSLDLLAVRFPKFRKFFNNWYVHKYLAGTLAATMAYIPINSFIFYEFSPVSPLVNFFLMPSVFFVIVFGFLMAIAGIFGAIGLFLAGILAFPVWILLSIYDIVIQAFLRLPFAVLITGRPSFFIMGLAIATAVIFIYIINKGKHIPRRLGLLCAAVFLGFCAQFAASALNPFINITFLCVGQGESTVISRGRNALIIDGGGVFGREAGENTGAFTLVPYLNYRGINQATAIVTHNHRDHAMGVAEALLAGRINHLILARANSASGYYMYDLLRYAAEVAGARVSYISAGDAIEFGGARLYVLFPYDDQILQGVNDNSVTLQMIFGNHSILFTGDIEAAAETYLAERGGLRADVLQVAHHGSRSSTTQAFLEAVNPQFAVISAGRNNMFNHPHPSVTNRLYGHGVEYFVTASRGAVLVRTDGRRLEIRSKLEIRD